MRVTVRDLGRLGRWRLSLMVAATALAGFVLHARQLDGQGLLAATGIFLLAAGASAANQVQERATDALMARTRTRPLASGRMTPAAGLAIALLAVLGGSTLLAGAGPLPLLVALAALAVYLGVYTPLKRHTPFAVLPGALAGALPPLVGWTAAGGHPAALPIVLVAGFFFLWQVPHFWVFAWRHRDDYRRAGLCLGPANDGHQLCRLLAVWVASLAALGGPLALLLATGPAATTAFMALLILPLTVLGFALSRPQRLSLATFSSCLHLAMAVLTLGVIAGSLLA